MGTLHPIGILVLFGSCAKTVGCNGTEQLPDNQEVDTLPGYKCTLSGDHQGGRSGGQGWWEACPRFNLVFVVVCLLRESDLVNA